MRMNCDVLGPAKDGNLAFSRRGKNAPCERLGSADELSKLGKKSSESRFPENGKPGRNPRYIGSYPALS
jgi:hypothetical protein